MPILLLKSKDIDLITGKKNITIRKLWKNPLYPGDRLYCYWNILSKEREKIFEAEVTAVNILTYEELLQNNKIIQDLGYKSSKELEQYLKETFPNNCSKESQFQVFSFHKLPVNEWEGSIIDQKNMIVKKADILFDMGKFNQSSLCYKAALEYDPQDSSLLNRIGDNLTRLGQFGDAIKYYKKALKLEPNNEYLYNNIAIVYLNRQDPVRALKMNTEAFKINPENTTILYWRGIIFEMLNDFEKALEFFDYILEIDDTNSDVWSERGTILNMLGKSEEALESYDKSIALCLNDNEDANTWASKGNTLLGLQRYSEAIECYDEALNLGGDNPIILNNKGVAFMELGNFESAMECFTKVLAEYPNNPDAQVLHEVCLDNL